MITFKSITLRNFLSYGNVPTPIVFDRPGTTLVLGEDLDNTTNGTGGNGAGKFQSVNSLVKTHNGWIRMGDIEIGQMLQMPDGTSAPVIKKFPQGKQLLYKVKFADGRNTLAGGPHLWKVQSHRWQKNHKSNASKILTTLEVKKYVDESKNKSPKFNITIPTIFHPKIKDYNFSIDPYLMGAILGDGCLSTPHLIFSSTDGEIIKQINNILKTNFQRELVQYKDGPDYNTRNIEEIRGKNKDALNECLESFSLKGTKSHTKFIPSEYLIYSSKQQKLNLLQGILDTDGTVDKSGSVSFTTTSKQLSSDVQYIVRSLGGKASIMIRTPYYRNIKGEKTKGKIAYELRIQYKNPKKLFTLQRKLNRISDKYQYSNAGLRIVSIEPSITEECQCIMVDHPDRLYITDDFIVTHNTALMNGLVYAAYDKAISDISKDNLVNNLNKKNMEVILEFDKNGTAYKIVRARKMKAGAAGNYVHLYEDGKDVTPDSVSNTNAMIEKIIGFPYELFVRVVAFSAENDSFFNLPVRSTYAANQTDIIEELFNLKRLSEKALLLKDEIKTTELSIKTQASHIEQLEREHDRHEIQLESAKKRVIQWEVKNKNDIDHITKKLKKVAEVDVDQQRELYDELADVDRQLQAALTKQQELERAVEEIKKKIKKAKDENTHLKKAKCPYCLQTYKDTKKKIKENEETVKLGLRDGAKYESTLEVTTKQIEELASQHKDIKSKITVSNLDELLEINSKLTHYQSQVDELIKSDNPFIEPLDELEEIKLDEIDMTKMNELKSTLDHQKFLLKLLTKKDSFVRKVLLNKNIPFLNQRLAHYLKEIGLQHNVKFTHEMTASISQFGHPMDFGNLSNGQRARVNIALSFAFRDVLQSMHDTINICMLDEVLDVGLNALGIQAAATMLKQKARDEDISVYIISHRDEIDSAFDHRLTVQMSKGFSYLKFED